MDSAQTLSSAGRRNAIAPPSKLLWAREALAWPEICVYVAAMPWWGLAPRGDGHPVLVLPGLMQSDLSTRPLRRFLRARGYDASGWGLGSNTGRSGLVDESLLRRLRMLHKRHGRKVSLIGWSMGGLFARDLARQAPESARQVITLGSPFTVPLTSIYSRRDGIVAWQCCVGEPGPQRENIAVTSTHCGMGHHPAVQYAVADRLALAEGCWTPFAPPNFARWMFPALA